MTIRIRPMRTDDLAEVLPLEQALFAADPPWTLAQFQEELTGVPETRWYVVATGAAGDRDAGTDGVVGYAGLRAPDIPGEPADVQTIAVAPDHQRQGIGTLLMNALIDEARARDAGWVMLEVRADNDAALALYSRYGFERVTTRRAYYGGRCDGLVMRRRLRKGERRVSGTRG